VSLYWRCASASFAGPDRADRLSSSSSWSAKSLKALVTLSTPLVEALERVQREFTSSAVLRLIKRALDEGVVDPGEGVLELTGVVRLQPVEQERGVADALSRDRPANAGD
jgi:hypothetical protein